MRPVVSVILATYNGARYLGEQLESLAMQTVRPDRLVLRDDGSADDSVAIVRRWCGQTGVRLQVEAGPRLGPARSFLTALRAAEPADIYAFCDQDDVWLPHRIATAVTALPWQAGGAPTLHATRLEIVDADLRHAGHSPLPRRLSFGSAVCESVLTGCTMTFNSAFRELLARKVPEHALMHDWWCYLLATGAGDLIYDPVPTVRYRQHGGNALGQGPTGLRLAKVRLQRFLAPGARLRSKQLEEFAASYARELKPGPRALAESLLYAKSSIGRRLHAAATAPVVRQHATSTLTTRVAILANRY